MKECLNYKKINSETLQCLACSHFCKIQEGRTGICGIRQNIKGKLYLLTYGKAIAMNVDPIEKKPFFHFLPGSKSLSFGTVGCNMQCKNCQNFDISQMFGYKGKVENYKKINLGYSISPEQIVDEAIKTKCESIAYTYNEPTVFLEYALDTMKLAKKHGIKNVWVSNGFMSKQTLDLIIKYVDAVNIDIKSFDNEFYKLNCGAELKPVLENCKRLIKEKIWLEITTLIIPTLSDDKKMLKQIAKFIKNELGDFVPWHISAFSGAISWKLKHIPDTQIETIEKAYKIGKQEGLKYIYVGNLWKNGMENTFCPKCNNIVIERLGYNIKRKDEKGKCANCKTQIQGIF
ncbi:AmmeMemoRadiSam system radical SAM enzyme [bacterium]|nr:AmmeMemoRadiSam system radical SAM enzyme [bacterium]